MPHSQRALRVRSAWILIVCGWGVFLIAEIMYLAYSWAFSAQALQAVEDIPPEVHVFLLCAAQRL